MLLVSAAFCLSVSALSETRVYASSDDKRVMTIEDYLMDGEAVYEKDLEAVSDEAEQGYDEVPGDWPVSQKEKDGGEAEPLMDDSPEKSVLDGSAKEFPGSLDDWNLILVNKQNPVPADYEYRLSSLNGSMEADKRIIGQTKKLLRGAMDDGVELMICSAYRSFERQTELFDKKLNKLMKSGMSYFDAYRTASYSVTLPGTSEHQLGLALDIITPGYTDLNSGFAETKAGKWLKENAPDYGFILRYPEGKEYITGIIFEPWHFRYVGIENARYMTEKGLTLEEYTELLKDHN